MTETQIIEHCRSFGLDVREVRRDSGLLQLVPAGSLEGAPWNGLVEALKAADDSLRWVTLVIEDNDD